MARLTNRERRKKRNSKALLAMLCMMTVVNSVLQLYLLIMDLIAERDRQRIRHKPHLRANPNYFQHQIDALNRLVHQSDTTCHNQLRVNRHTFMTLCHLLTENGLEPSRNVTVVEKVVIFLWILSHHTKNKRTILQFWRSGETISRHFHTVLIAVLRLNKYCGIILSLFLPMSQMLGGSGLRTQCRIVTACCLLHNLIKRTMAVDPVEAQYTAWEQANLHNIPPDEYVRTLESTNHWTQMRDNLATQMYNDWVPNIMESEGIAQFQTSSAKDKQPRRLWTHKEEECLLAAMMECISEKYRAHNGFKPGYFNEVEKELK
ncbi:hypothetical protein RHMOL_Rhmol11G0152300 [Rhododendron molle]|uniref:Uncharacterized protein n=1 Tax=Rhododendron molle TaxID=49168 RepID=A0ACC0LSP8_RHOML|nr:hypothetical protein RHMOL_Rhmol11G0152300 [Rhododendron molle]